MTALLLAVFLPFVAFTLIGVIYHYTFGKKYKDQEQGIYREPKKVSGGFVVMTPEQQNEYAKLLTNLVVDAINNGEKEVTIKYSDKTPPIDPYFITTLTFKTGRTLVYNDEGDGFTISIF